MDCACVRNPSSPSWPSSSYSMPRLCWLMRVSTTGFPPLLVTESAPLSPPDPFLVAAGDARPAAATAAGGGAGTSAVAPGCASKADIAGGIALLAVVTGTGSSRDGSTSLHLRLWPWGDQRVRGNGRVWNIPLVFIVRGYGYNRIIRRGTCTRA